jgi:hypothetical protein
MPTLMHILSSLSNFVFEDAPIYILNSILKNRGFARWIELHFIFSKSQTSTNGYEI